MKHLHEFITSLLFLTSIILFLTGCSSVQTKNTCPFTEITWNSTPEDIRALEGELQDSYYSSFKGTTYVYNKEYLGLKGTIKYMFDDANRLRSTEPRKGKRYVCFGWRYFLGSQAGGLS